MSIEDNKNKAIEFYRMAYLGKPKEAIEKYVGKQYIQHNPEVANGTDGFIAYFERMQKEYPQKSIEFVRCIAEAIWLLCIPIKLGPVMSTMLPWISFVLMIKAKSVSNGTLFKRFPNTLPTPIRCIDF